MSRLETRARLICLLCMYPAYWIGTVLVNAIPPLIEALGSGGGVVELRVSWRGLAVMAPGAARGWSSAFAAAVCAAVFAWLGRRRHAVLWGVMLSMLGAVAAGPALLRLFFLPGASWAWVVRGGLGVGCLLLGSRWLLYAIAGRTYLARFAHLLITFGLPVGLALPDSSGRAVRNAVPFQVACFTLPAAIALAAALRTAPQHVSLTWRPALALLSAAAILFGAGWSGDRALRRHKAEVLQAELDGVPPIPAYAPFEKSFFQRGVNFTAEFPGGYSSATALRLLRELSGYGVNAIALVPYGFTPRETPSVRFPGGWESDESVTLVSRVAHHLGMKVLLKPQLWVRPGYPGDLDFPSADLRRRWFSEYRRFAEHYAKLAAAIHADMYCVGVEFARLSVHDYEWREIIADARRHYPGPLVYAANFGPEFESIRFWDALDYIGLNNYYPLPDDLSMGEILGKVERVAEKFGKPVIFTEAGFSSFENPHRQPWDETPRKLDPEAQARAYDAVFQAFYHRPWFAGVYWWKVGTNGAGGLGDGAHTPWRKPAMEVVGRWYRNSSR